MEDPTDKARHDQMVTLVERMLELHKQLAEAKTPQAKTVLQRQIEATDRQIDRLVFELYGLTEEEIKIVEEQPPLSPFFKGKFPLTNSYLKGILLTFAPP